LSFKYSPTIEENSHHLLIDSFSKRNRTVIYEFRATFSKLPITVSATPPPHFQKEITTLANRKTSANHEWTILQRMKFKVVKTTDKEDHTMTAERPSLVGFPTSVRHHQEHKITPSIISCPVNS
jgi:hypothetical protein